MGGEGACGNLAHEARHAAATHPVAYQEEPMGDEMSHVTELAERIGPRPATTDNEAEAAGYVQGVFEGRGLSVTRQEFDTPRTYGWAYAAYHLLTLLAAVVSLWFGWPAFVLALAVAIVMRFDLDTRFGLTSIMPKGPSQNVIGRFNPRVGRNERARKVVVVAHCDSARSSLAFSPAMAKGFDTTFGLMKWITYLAPLVIFAFALPWTQAWKPWTWYATLVFVVYLVVPMLINVHRELLGKPVAGANDNASGVAVMLALVERIVPEPEVTGMTGALPKVSGEQAALEAGVVPEGATLTYASAESAAPTWSGPVEWADDEDSWTDGREAGGGQGAMKFAWAEPTAEESVSLFGGPPASAPAPAAEMPAPAPAAEVAPSAPEVRADVRADEGGVSDATAPVDLSFGESESPSETTDVAPPADTSHLFGASAAPAAPAPPAEPARQPDTTHLFGTGPQGPQPAGTQVFEDEDGEFVDHGHLEDTGELLRPGEIDFESGEHARPLGPPPRHEPIPERRGLLGLFGRGKPKRAERDGMGEWLGVDEGFDARKEGKTLGTWETLAAGDEPHDEDDDEIGWKGGAAAIDEIEDPGYAASAAARIRRKVTSHPERELLEKEVWFVATGAEEVGTYGMRAFLRAYGDELDDAFIINIDNVGSGKVVYVSSEGMAKHYDSDRRMMSAARRVVRDQELDIRSRAYRGLSTDATPALARGFRAMSVMAFDINGRLPNWHWHTDTVENVQAETMASATDFVAELIKEL